MSFRHTRFQGAILDGSRVLLIQHHALATNLKYWVMPGGGIEPDESEVECVQREMLEETGLHVSVGRVAVDLIEPRGRLYRRQKTFLCSAVGGDLAPGDEPEVDNYEITDTTWLDLSDPEGWTSILTGDEWMIPLLWELRVVLGLGEWPGHVRRLPPVPPLEPSNGTDVVVRLGKPDDQAGWLRLVGRVVAQMKSEGSAQWNSTYPGETEFGHDVAARTLCLAEIDDHIVGSVTACEEHPKEYRNVEWPSGRRCLVIHRIAVDPDFRRRGVARELLRAAHRFARRAGYASCRLDVPGFNAGARALYESEGYLEVATMELWGMESVCYELPLPR